LGAKKTPKKPKQNSHNPMIRSPMVEGDWTSLNNNYII
jgi:hypothetical protein